MPAWMASEAMAERRTTSEQSSASSSWKTLRVSVIRAPSHPNRPVM